MGEKFWLSDAEWAAIEPLLPRLGGKPRVDDRRVISGILHRYRGGPRWWTIPIGYGPLTTLLNRWNRWSEKGIRHVLLTALLGLPRFGGRLKGLLIRSARWSFGAAPARRQSEIGNPGPNAGGRGCTSPRCN